MQLTNDPIVSIDNLTFSRGDKLIFNGISLQIPRGQITAIMGPSGVGKSTLLRLIGGQLMPDAGKVWVQGRDVATLTARELQRLRRDMGLLFQAGALFTDLSVFDNVAFLLREHTKLPETLVRALVLMKLEAVGLRGAHHLMVNQLSGGMARRVALARAVMLDPALMMYDEPFTGQDPINRGVLIKLIREMNDAMQMTSIVVSHDVREVAAVADYVYVIAEGQLIGQGTPEQLAATQEAKLLQFVQGLPDGPVPFRYPAAPWQEELGLC